MSSKLRARYPDFDFMGEETYAPGQKLAAPPTFVVDPIDGTTNFVHGFPAACVSVGLTIDRRPVVGVVYNPYQDCLYHAVRGGGAYMTIGADWGLEGGKGRCRRLPLAANPAPLAGLQRAVSNIRCSLLTLSARITPVFPYF